MKMTDREYLEIYNRNPFFAQPYFGQEEDKVAIIEYNKELCKKYPFLKPKDRATGLVNENYNYTFTELDDMPTGWRLAFGIQMCEEIKQALIKAQELNPTGGYEESAITANYNSDNILPYLEGYHITQIKEKYGCYDKETEVLTRDGWKYFKDVVLTDEFATLDSDGKTLIYQKPSDIIQYNYSGPMYYLNCRGVNLCVTPNHNLYVAKGSYVNGKIDNFKRYYDFEFCTPDKYFGQKKRFKKGCIWQGTYPGNIMHIDGYVRTSYMKRNNCTRTYHYDDFECDMHSFLRFLGFYIAEGCTSFKHSNGTEVSIAYNYLDEEDLIVKLISDIGMSPKNGNRGIKRIYNVTLAHWLLDNCGHLAFNKKVPNFVKTLPQEYIKEFLTYLFIGDGHKTATSNTLTTTSSQLCNDVCELLLKAGDVFYISSREPKVTKCTDITGARIITGKHRVYDINWLTKSNEVEISTKTIKQSASFEEKYINYDGFVYCVTIPNHILYVRRNGKGVWCGNSLRWYDNGAPQEVYDIISKYEHLSYQTCVECGNYAEYISRGWICPFCGECVDRLGLEADKIGDEESVL